MEASSVFQLKETTISKRDCAPSENISDGVTAVLWLLEDLGSGYSMLCAVELGTVGPQMWSPLVPEGSGCWWGSPGGAVWLRWRWAGSHVWVGRGARVSAAHTWIPSIATVLLGVMFA